MSDSGDEVEFRKFARLLRSHALLILLCTAVTVGTVAVYTFSVAPKYEARSSIRIDEGRSRLPALDVLRDVAATREVSTEIEVLHSRRLFDFATRQLALQARLAEPRRVSRNSVFARIDVSENARTAKYTLRRQLDGRFTIEDGSGTLRSGIGTERIEFADFSFSLKREAAKFAVLELRVESYEDVIRRLENDVRVARPTREASIVTVRFTDSDPEIARDVVNAIVEQFIALRSQGQKSEVRSTAQFLTGQLDTLRLQLGRAEDALRVFRESQSIVDLPSEASSGVSRLAALQAERTTVNTERQALAALVAEVEASSPGGREGNPSAYRRLLAYPTLLRNQAAAEMLRALALTEDQRAELRNRRSQEDPDVRALDARVRELESQLRSIALTYLQGLTNQVGAFDAALVQSARLLDQIPAKELRFARLQREAKVLEDLNQLLETRLREAQIAASVNDESIQVIDQAVLPKKAVSPIPALNLAAAAIVGLLIGATLTLLREYTNRRIRSRSDLHWAAGVPVLGLIPRLRLTSQHRRWLFGKPADRQLRTGPLGPVRAQENWISTPSRRKISKGTKTWFSLNRSIEGAEAVLEAYSRLLMSMRIARPDRRLITILVTSPVPGDGKTTTALNLAFANAQYGRRTLLIDADLRRGSLHTVFKGRSEPGLSNVLAGSTPLDAVLRSAGPEFGCLDYIAAGSLLHHPSKLLVSQDLPDVMRQLCERYELIILDSPPANLVTDASLLAAHVDGVLLVARARRTLPEALTFAMEQFHGSSAPVLGTVLNDIDLQKNLADDDAYQWQRDSYQYAATE